MRCSNTVFYLKKNVKKFRYYKIDLNFGTIFLKYTQNCITASYFYTISCEQKFVLRNLSISTLSVTQANHSFR